MIYGRCTIEVPFVATVPFRASLSINYKYDFFQSHVSYATIKEYIKIWIMLAPRFGAFDRFYYDATDNRDWICSTLEILIKPCEKRLAHC